jgi:hypothetical protein
MFEDMRRGGGMPEGEGAPPSEEGMGMEDGMTCPSCGAKFVLEKQEEEAPEMSEGME